MNIFEPTDPPSRLRRFPFAAGVPWRTWSSEFRHFLREWDRYARSRQPPAMKLVGRRRPYGETYWHRVESDLAQPVREFARSLSRAVSPGEMMFFENLLGRFCSRRGLHLLFAAMRESMVDAARGDSRCALYNPLGSVGADEGEFPLHADLYAPRYLFNIFDHVPRDGSGASLFLSLADFRDVLRGTASLTPGTRRRILRCLAPVVTGDRYDEFYRLLYGFDVPWRRELSRRMQQAQHVIPFRRGDGYLLDDRRWLHGREAPTGGVTRNRIHRLIFDSPRSAAARRRVTGT